MEIRVDGTSLSVTMRTPGDDFDLAIGYLLTEGVIAEAGDVLHAMHCLDEDENGSPTYNVVDITLAPDAKVDTSRTAALVLHLERLWGVRQDEHRRDHRTEPVCRGAGPAARLTETVAGLPGTLREHQRVFDRTGGLHAAGLFTRNGELLAVREDVGRHNAVDKVIGWAGREDHLPLTGYVLVVSGRASFELTQKAMMAGIPALVAVSAPSSLAVELAADAGLTLVGLRAAPADDGLHRRPQARPLSTPGAGARPCRNCRRVVSGVRPPSAY